VVLIRPSGKLSKGKTSAICSSGIRSIEDHLPYKALLATLDGKVKWVTPLCVSHLCWKGEKKEEQKKGIQLIPFDQIITQRKETWRLAPPSMSKSATPQ
jgi:hypothetical protein